MVAQLGIAPRSPVLQTGANLFQLLSLGPPVWDRTIVFRLSTGGSVKLSYRRIVSGCQELRCSRYGNYMIVVTG